MKKFLNITVLGLLLGVVSSLHAAVGDGVWIWASYSPNDSVKGTFATFNGKAQSFLRGNSLPGIRSENPTDFWIAERFDYRRAIVSVNTPLWNGVLNPSQHGDQRGGRLIFPIRIVSSMPFVPSEVWIEIRSNDPYEGHPLGSLGFIAILSNWAPEATALWYGNDQIKGTADDEVRAGGNAPANELYYTGAGTAFIGEDLSGINVINTYMSSIGPNFAVSATVGLKRGNGTIFLPLVVHRISVEGAPRIILSSDRKYWVVAPESQGNYFVQSSDDFFRTWAIPNSRLVTAGQVVGVVENSGSRFFRLLQVP